jgi:diguanylate cyclase (GGDEF)-like protein
LVAKVHIFLAVKELNMQEQSANNSLQTSAEYDSLYQNEIDFERIKILYKAGYNGLIGSFLIITCFPLFMFYRLDHKVLLIWTILIFAVNLPRAALLRAFNSRLKNNLITIDNIKHWENYFIIGFCSSGVLWCSTVFLPYHSDIVICLFFVVLVQVGISAVVASMYSASKKLVRLYFVVTLIPVCLKLFASGSRPLIIVAFIGIVFLAILNRAVTEQSKNLIKIISLKIQNEELSRKDTLTGLWNRRQLSYVVEKLIPHSIRHNEVFSIVLMDIDNFKKHNDTRGHAAGDESLKIISELILNSIRKEDIAVRYGGEEFLLILPLATSTEAYMIGERIRQLVKAKTKVTISGGVSTFSATKSFDEMTVEADNLLYKAKKSGRDMVCK